MQLKTGSDNWLSPIVIFVYNRAERVQNLMLSLAQNPEAKDSIVYIYSDGEKIKDGADKVQEVRRYIDGIQRMNIFSEVYITKAEKNKGLACSIIDGVTQVMRKHGCAIVIEDDNVVSPDFLDYMNRALIFFKDDPKIWAISGFSRRMIFPSDYHHDIYVMQRLSSYAWASWRDRWEMAEWNGNAYPEFLWNRKKRKAFSSCGDDRPLMLDAQACGKISSWAIRFEYSMVFHDMYSILPCNSRVVCNGNDGSGTHSTKVNHCFDTEISDDLRPVIFEHLHQDERIRKEYIKVYKNSWRRKLIGNTDHILTYYIGKLRSKK